MIHDPTKPGPAKPIASSEMPVECGRLFFDIFENERGKRLRITRLNIKGIRQFVTINSESYDEFLGHVIQHRDRVLSPQ